MRTNRDACRDVFEVRPKPLPLRQTAAKIIDKALVRAWIRSGDFGAGTRPRAHNHFPVPFYFSFCTHLETLPRVVTIPMASLSLCMRQLARRVPAAHPRALCCRCFSSAPPLQSGHNKWSKIKHDKAAADAKMSQRRIYFSRNIAILSKRASSPWPLLRPA